jgi:cobalt-zinc-cadmium efflux system outer membrane protein
VRALLGTAFAVLSISIRVQAAGPACPAVATAGALVRCAQDGSERIARSRAELEAIQGRRDAAGRLLPSNPTVDVGIGYRRTEDGATDIDRGIELAQTFEIGGQRGARISAAEAELRAARAFADAAKSAVAVEVLGAATQVVRARLALAIARDQSETAGRLVEISEARAARGFAAPFETELAQAARVQALREERATAQELSDAEARLAEAASADVQLAPDARIPETRLDFPPLDRLLQRALELRPDLIAARASVESSAARADVLRRERIPDLTLGAGARHEEFSNILSARLIFPVPVVRRNQGEIAEQEARTRQAAAAARQEELKIRLQVQGAYRSWQRAQATAAAIGADLEARLAADVQALRSAYERGRLPLTAVLASLRETQAARRSLVEARADVAQAALNLARAAALDPCGEGGCQ